MEPIIIGYVILGLVVAAFIAAGIYLLVRSDLPPYKFKKEAKKDGIRVRVFAQTQALIDRYETDHVIAAAKALMTASDATPLNDDVVKQTLSDIVVLITTRDGFQRWAYWNSDTAASVFVLTRDKIYQKEIPMVVVHEGTLDKLQALGGPMFKGRPVIHELLHAVLFRETNGNPDASHSEKEYWGDLIRKAEELYEASV